MDRGAWWATVHGVAESWKKGALEDRELQKGTQKGNPSETVAFERHCFCEKRSVQKNGGAQD